MANAESKPPLFGKKKEKKQKAESMGWMRTLIQEDIQNAGLGGLILYTLLGRRGQNVQPAQTVSTQPVATTPGTAAAATATAATSQAAKSAMDKLEEKFPGLSTKDEALFSELLSELKIIGRELDIVDAFMKYIDDQSYDVDVFRSFLVSRKKEVQVEAIWIIIQGSQDGPVPGHSLAKAADTLIKRKLLFKKKSRTKKTGQWVRKNELNVFLMAILLVEVIMIIVRDIARYFISLN